MTPYIKSLVELKPYMIVTYGFNRMMVARALVKFEEKTSERPCIIIMSKWHSGYAGMLIAKAKRDSSIVTTFRTNGRYYKFTDRVNL